ncbi:M6 family metalloprotease domain-containing protein [Streptomyces sp. NPDC087300]|uniref:M6 family metalloprotease domain-containing protein n=1 Tax=Streptomyces sp. NPDC087300 TaxID=3365780 RepID=UPI00382ECD9F
MTMPMTMRVRRAFAFRPVRRIARGALAATTAAVVLAVTSPLAAAAPHRAAPPSGPCALAPPAHAGWEKYEGLPTPGNYRKSTGTVRAYTVFIDFSDAPAEGPPQDRYAEFFPAVADHFAASSYGKLTYESTPHLKWIRMSKPFREYGIDRGVPFEPGYSAITREITEAVGDDADLGSYDVLNVLATPNAGPDAVDKVLSVTFSGGVLDFGKGRVPWAGSFIWSRQTGDSAWRVLNHENGHAFGLPDLYGTGQEYRRHPVGHWDVMDEDWGPTNDFMAWHKWKLGWLDEDQVGCQDRVGTREFTLSPLSAKGGVKLIAVPVSDTDVITVEARTRSGLDPAVCRPGVLISRVSTDTRSGHNPVRVSDATPDSGGCVHRSNVYAELSDATYVPGTAFTDRRHGVTVRVVERSDDGTYTVRITRRHLSGT